MILKRKEVCYEIRFRIITYFERKLTVTFDKKKMFLLHGVNTSMYKIRVYNFYFAEMNSSPFLQRKLISIIKYKLCVFYYNIIQDNVQLSIFLNLLFKQIEKKKVKL